MHNACTPDLAADYWDLPLLVTSDSIYSINDMSSELNDLETIGEDFGISTIHNLEDEMQKPALKVDR